MAERDEKSWRRPTASTSLSSARKPTHSGGCYRPIHLEKTMYAEQEPRGSETSNMTDRIDESRETDEAIWGDAVTLEPADTKDAKVHVTLRLDANVYRAIIAEKKAAKDRTITSTIERLLSNGLEKSRDRADVVLHAAVRNLLAHSVAQDAVLQMLTRYVKPRSPKDKRLFDLFMKHSGDLVDIHKWLDEIYGAGARESILEHKFMSFFFEPPRLDAPGESARTSAR